MFFGPPGSGGGAGGNGGGQVIQLALQTCVANLQAAIGQDPGSSYHGDVDPVQQCARNQISAPSPNYGSGGGGGGATPPKTGFGHTPVHGPWTYGHWCGAGGSGTPNDPTDAACRAHDYCYDQSGFTPGSNFQGYNPALQACNQKFCDAVKARRQSLLDKTRVLPGPTWTGAYPVYNQYPQTSEMRADTQINLYFSLIVAPGGNACH
jgi:hypothetical protein